MRSTWTIALPGMQRQPSSQSRKETYAERQQGYRCGADQADPSVGGGVRAFGRRVGVAGRNDAKRNLSYTMAGRARHVRADPEWNALGTHWRFAVSRRRRILP